MRLADLRGTLADGVIPRGRGDRPSGSGGRGRSLAGRFFALDVGAAACIGALIVIAIGLPLGATLNIWIDEAFTLHSTGAGPVTAWTQSAVFEAQPPLYFVLESLWRTWEKNSVAFARVPSTLFAAAAVAVIVAAAKRMAPRVPSIAVALVAASNPLVIWAAVEMRVYPLVLLVGAGLAGTYFSGFLVEAPSRRAQIAYALFAIVGMYTQYYVGFLLAAQAATLVIARRMSLRAFAVATAVIALAFAPLVTVALTHVASSGQFVIPTTLAQAVHEVLDSVFVVLLPHDVSWTGLAKIAGFAVAAVLAVMLGIVGRPARPHGATGVFILSWAICLCVFTALFTLAGVPLVSIKYLTVVAPSSLIVGFMVFSSMERARALAGGIALMAYASFTGTALWTRYEPPTVKPGDWQRVAAAIAADPRETPVAVFPAELAVPLGWYLPIAMVSIPRPMIFTLDYVRRTALADESQVSRVLDPVRARSKRLWLVTTGECMETDLDYYNYHCRFMEAYMQRRYRLVRSVSFQGALARLYVRFPSPTADLQEKHHAN